MNVGSESDLMDKNKGDMMFVTPSRQEQIIQLENEWMQNSRWKGVVRPYSAERVISLRGSLQLECLTFAHHTK